MNPLSDEDIRWLERSMRPRPRPACVPEPDMLGNSDELLACLACWARVIYARMREHPTRNTCVVELARGDEDKLRTLLADVDRHFRTGGDKAPACYQCGQVMAFRPRELPEPEIGYRGWRGGYVCDCGHADENEVEGSDEC